MPPIDMDFKKKKSIDSTTNCNNNNNLKYIFNNFMKQDLSFSNMFNNYYTPDQQTNNDLNYLNDDINVINKPMKIMDSQDATTPFAGFGRDNA